ncbi:hypothetical protein GOP47_0008419 [Adiantum capillus-veneris]|uniref:Protein kinase domain-containing protein n=1 Tax=Adiantum capillus-veneris TaxID=13818 RepID=A0A9D4UYI7_ADICA|nr:hypothetical protein GOP47_0008419 [Adiantum capillus-veneris]
MTQLNYLNLPKNQLSGGIPRGLGNCTQLAVIGLAFNQLSGFIPEELGNGLSKLQALHIYGNNLTGMIPSSLGNSTKLLSVDLGFNQLSGTIPAELKSWSLLEMLSLPWNYLSGPLEILDFRNFTQLYSAELQFNEMSGSLSKIAFTRLRQLQYLDVGSNRFTGEIPWDAISLCKSLFNLSLANNHLTGKISMDLEKLENLKYLYLQGNLLHGGIPDLGGTKLKLLELDLSMNQLNGSLPLNLASVVSELAGALSHNRFSGFLPLWLGQLVMAQSIDLSNNHFSGAIPEGLGECIALTVLDVSRNQLSGELPLQLGNLDYLVTLNMAFNNLSGELPSFLSTKLPRLRHLNVSFNNFTGFIPQHEKGVFRYLNASSFLGNPGLCGPLLNKECSTVSFTRDRHRSGIWLTNWRGIFLMTLALSLALVFVLILLVVICYRRSAHAETQLVDQDTEMSYKFSVGSVAAKRFSAQELFKATQGYSEVNLLGQGGSSVVFKGVLEDGNSVAVKVLKDVGKGSSHEAFLRETQILSRLKHRSLVRILGSVRNLDVQALVLEYMGNGSLETYLDMHRQHMSADDYMILRGPFTYWEALSAVAMDIAEALNYLHHDYGEPIIHGDVKPSNILFDADLKPRLADFGLAKLVKREEGALTLSSSFKGSIGYMAPEYAYAARITTKVDVYGYGVVLLRMLTGLSPTHSSLDGQTLHEWVKMKLPVDQDGIANIDAELLDAALVQVASDTCTKLVDQLLKIGLACTADRPEDRPTIHQVLDLITSYQYQKDLSHVRDQKRIKA